MPYTNKKILSAKRRRSKRVYASKKKAYRNKLAVIPRTISSLGKGFPKKLVVTHKYMDNITLQSNTGIPTNYTFSCNGIYDPNITAGGTHRPMYWDQLINIYDHYTVIGSKITCKVYPAASTQVPVAMAFFINDDTTSIAGVLPRTIAEQNSAANFKLLTYNSTGTTLKRYWSAKKMFGSGVLANNSLQGNASGNPTEQSFYQFVFNATDNTSNVGVYLTFQIEYTVVWAELKDIATS